MTQDITKIDPNMAQREPDGSLLWYDLRNLNVEGKGWSDTESFYDRYPAKAKGTLRQPVWDLSQHSAGMLVRFITNAPRLAVRWEPRFGSLAMDHMPSTGVSGLDLYVQHEGQWRWAGVARGAKHPLSQAVMVSGMKPAERHMMLYLPLYNGVKSVQLGLPPEATLAPAPPRPEGRDQPILFYGSSIVQGGCASRPGMAYPAILCRHLDHAHLNLGFSGNAKSEPEVANLLAEQDPAAFVLDPLPNMSVQEVTERIGPLVLTIRKARPRTPIILVANVIYQNSHLLADRRDAHLQRNAVLELVIRRLRRQGVDNLSYVPPDNLLGSDGEGTVDGTHPTDVGFQRMADAIEPVLRSVL